MTDDKLKAETGHFRLTGHQATVRVIANFAWQHLKAATIFRDELVKLERDCAGQPFGSFFDRIRSYASACILSSAASLEALINELFIAHNTALRQLLTDFDTQFWDKRGIEGKSILDKYQLALRMMGKPEFIKDASPYRDVWAIIELRNALVHYKPTWDEVRQRQIDLNEVLAGKFQLSPFPDVGADFVSMKCMSEGCASWVIATCLGFIAEFDSRTRLDDSKMDGFRKLAEESGIRFPHPATATPPH